MSTAIWIPDSARPPRRQMPAHEPVRFDGTRLLEPATEANPHGLSVRAIRHLDAQGCKVWWDATGLSVIVSVDDTPDHGPLLHISISRAHSYPSWDEQRAILDALAGDVDMMMIRPRQQNYVNIHPYAMHWYQTPDAWRLQ